MSENPQQTTKTTSLSSGSKGRSKYTKTPPPPSSSAYQSQPVTIDLLQEEEENEQQQQQTKKPWPPIRHNDRVFHDFSDQVILSRCVENEENFDNDIYEMPVHSSHNMSPTHSSEEQISTEEKCKNKIKKWLLTSDKIASAYLERQKIISYGTF